MKISFDYDCTLTQKRIQLTAKKFIDSGHDVWITTSREDDENGDPRWNQEVYEIAESLNIPKTNIQFTNGADKWVYLMGFDLHFDDSEHEILIIEENLLNCATILVNDIYL